MCCQAINWSLCNISEKACWIKPILFGGIGRTKSISKKGGGAKDIQAAIQIDEGS